MKELVYNGFSYELSNGGRVIWKYDHNGEVVGFQVLDSLYNDDMIIKLSNGYYDLEFLKDHLDDFPLFATSMTGWERIVNSMNY